MIIKEEFKYVDDCFSIRMIDDRAKYTKILAFVKKENLYNFLKRVKKYVTSRCPQEIKGRVCFNAFELFEVCINNKDNEDYYLIDTMTLDFVFLGKFENTSKEFFEKYFEKEKERLFNEMYIRTWDIVCTYYG